MLEYRSVYASGDYAKASSLLEKSVLKDDKKSLLLWHLEKGTTALSLQQEDEAINHFQTALELIDRLFTTKLSSKVASLFINDSSDEFYGASYERSYAHYYLAQARYARFVKKADKLDLQGARAAILAWDSYFSELQRSASIKTLYQTDLMLKIFGGQIHEISEVRNDLQIALQLYKDALTILNRQGGIFSVFNTASTDYIKAFEQEGKKPSDKFYVETPAKKELEDFLHFKILSLTKEIRGTDFETQVKSLGPSEETKKAALKGPGNVVLVFEEGLIPKKMAKPFSFGLRGAMNAVGDSGAKNFIATVGVELVTQFAMNTLGLVPSRSTGPGSFIFAHDVTRLAVQEAAIEFELPMIESVPLSSRTELFILNDKGSVIKRLPLPVISENGEIAKVVLEEDVVARYVKTGTRLAVRHIVAIVGAMQVYNQLKGRGGDLLAKPAALATYVAATKGLSLLERADTRHWTTLPQTLRMAELKLAAGNYQAAIGNYFGDKAPETPTRVLGSFVVKSSGKGLHTFRFNP